MNILGFNIGQNYKGILNLGSTINSPLSGTLQAVTDGMGNASPLQLSTTDLSVVQGVVSRLLISTDITMRRSDNTLFFQYSNAPDVLEINGNTIRLNNLRGSTAIGHSVAAARLHVRGDGTNPIARFENSAGTQMFRVSQSTNGSLTIGDDTTPNFGRLELDASGNLFLICNGGQGKQLSLTNLNVSLLIQNSFAASGGFYFTIPNYNSTSGTVNGISINSGIAVTNAGNGNARIFNIGYTINNTAAQTGTATGIFLNATETALNGMTHNLMDLQVGGNSRFRVNSNGRVSISEHLFVTGFVEIGLGNYFGMANRFKITSPSDGVITFFNNNQTDFNRLQFGGTTNAFPALKRNGAGLEVRLADDSGLTSLQLSELTLSGNIIRSGRGRINFYSGDGNITLTNSTETGFNLLNFGGLTNAFPALKRNGAALEVRLADDSGYTRVTLGDLYMKGGVFDDNGYTSEFKHNYLKLYDGNYIYGYTGSAGFSMGNGLVVGVNTNTRVASAVLQADSTTKGFLPPRMTEAQRLAIAGGTPEVGLIVYQTDASDGLYVYKAGGWTLII